MNVIDNKLINAYTTLVLAEKYILSEDDRLNPMQELVPIKYLEEVSIRVSEKTIDVLGGD